MTKENIVRLERILYCAIHDSRIDLVHRIQSLDIDLKKKLALAAIDIIDIIQQSNPQLRTEILRFLGEIVDQKKATDIEPIGIEALESTEVTSAEVVHTFKKAYKENSKPSFLKKLFNRRKV